ncbi:MAG TPA: glycerophosphodiester phosphodiesterase [Spirochaetia bacterium]|nr:glycerophosphodiester phosphodiesterase [Spirochaetia bacterium]
MSRKPLVIAHEGWENNSPHTIDSISAAFAAGADMVEIDVRATRDRVVVLHHDPSLIVGGRQVELAAMSFGQLRPRERASERGDGGSFPLASLEDALVLARSRGGALNLDVKDDAVIDPAARLIRSMGMESSVILTGCEAARARRVRKRHPSLQVMLNVAEEDYALGRTDRRRFTEQICSQAVAAGCCGINLQFAHCDAALVEYAAMRYLPVSAWTVDSVDDLERLVSLGVHSITTNRVRALVNLLGASP